MNDREVRRNEIMDIARDLFTKKGVANTSVLDIARAAGASKETLYSWFGDKEGLIEAICLREAADINAALNQSLPVHGETLESTLETLGVALLSTLLNDWSLAINRAAMQSPRLAKTLLASGRFTVGPQVGRYFESQAASAMVRIEDGDSAFRLFFGLLMQDMQIRSLLYNQTIAKEQYREHAKTAVSNFLQLVSVDRQDL